MFAYTLPNLDVMQQQGGAADAEICDLGAAARAAVYRALAAIFGGPGTTDERRARANEVIEAAASLPYDFDPASVPLAGATAPDDVVGLTLADEIQAGLLNARTYFDDPTKVLEEIRRYYEYFRALMPDGDEDSLDHLATECAFMERVTWREATVSSDQPLLLCRRAELAFLDRHLGEWVPLLGSRVGTEGSDALFIWAVNLLVPFVAADLAHVKGLVGS